MGWRATTLLAAVALLVAGCGGGSSPKSAAAYSTRPDRPASMTLALGVKPDGQLTYGSRVAARPGTTLHFRARVFSSGGQQARNVVARLSAPRTLRLIGASELLQPITVDVANAQPLAGDLRTGIPLGPYPPDAAADLFWQMTVLKTDVGRLPQEVRLTLRGTGFTRTGTVTITPAT